MFITLCVIAYNEEKYLNNLLKCIEQQDYDHSNIELILINSASTDNTRALMEDYADKNKMCIKEGKTSFRDVVVADNPKKTLPAGWNIALKLYKGDAILKVDAHAVIPDDFVSKNVAILESGEYISGGQRPVISQEDTSWGNTLLLAEQSMFGSSIAPYRNNPGNTYVKSMFHAAYKREVFKKIGDFNEQLVRTEDNEIHYRMRKAGFKLCFSPDIISYQLSRSTLKSMLRQKFANGYWIGLTAGVCPGCLSIYHFVPFVFVAAIIFSAILCITCGTYGLFGGIIRYLTVLMWGAYWLLAIIMSIMAVCRADKKRNITCLLLPILFFMLHVSYGLGTIKGLVYMPFWLKGKRNGRD